jgi:hypothetical protein
MTSTPTAAPARPWWRGWADFWFRPADPTTFGFIRVCTGLLVLYVHLAYSVDLQAFFGKHGWYSADMVNRERREAPTYVTPFADWNDQVVFVRLSDYPHRRQALMGFLKALPPGPDQRAALAYLNRVSNFPDPNQARRALNYVRVMGTAERDQYLQVLEAGASPLDPKADKYNRATPDFFSPPARTVEERKQVADELRAFWRVLSRGEATPDDVTPSWSYVLDHFAELPPEPRLALVKYLTDLPEDPAARAARLDYLEYWNNDPRLAYRTGTNSFSVWFHVTDPTQMALVHAGVLVLIVMFTVGLFTRVTSVLVWVACVGYIHRTQQVLFGMDTMMNILLFYLMIGNSGAALSVDRLIARYRAARASLARTGTIDPATRAFLACPPPSVGAGFAQRLLQVHVCFIYAAAGLAKLKGPTWWSGTAFWEVVVNPEFTLLHYGWYESALRAVASVKPLVHAICIGAVWFTLFIEISLPFLVWTPARWIILLLATAMHAAIGVLMGLNVFELLMIVMFLAFLPDRVIRDRFRGGPGLPRFTFAFNPAVPAHARAAATAVALDPDNQVTPVAARGAAETAVAGADGAAKTGADGLRALSKGLRFLSLVSLLLWVPGVSRLLNRRLFPRPAPSALPPAAVPKPAPAAVGR